MNPDDLHCRWFDKLQKQINEFQYEERVDSSPPNYLENSLIHLVFREIESHQMMLNVVERDLDCIQKTREGNCLWTCECLDVLKTLEKKKCPLKWSKLTRGSSHAFHSIEEFEKYIKLRTEFLSQLLSHQPINFKTISGIQFQLLNSPESLCIVLRRVSLLL